MLARRYHEERCQNRFAAASASSCVASSRSEVAAQGGAVEGSPVGKSARIEARLNVARERDGTGGHERSDTESGHEKTGTGAEKGEHQTFRDELVQDTGTAGAERDADGDLALAGF